MKVSFEVPINKRPRFNLQPLEDINNRDIPILSDLSEKDWFYFSNKVMSKKLLIILQNHGIMLQKQIIQKCEEIEYLTIFPEFTRSCRCTWLFTTVAILTGAIRKNDDSDTSDEELTFNINDLRIFGKYFHLTKV
ncbi:hypothetical protein RCL_jg20328.t1 [Rhizophagus clarus]|uniref:Uncharacterized protein n=1 Tax=Rhizophagus clarus TaxID=94130 RepID=A0A8H3KY13_9GLOM|nr:hypothetical protein RCL_jg20328.t1 [Rhizophagus clarus]